MRGELDDALARLRRWDEVRQRLAGESAEAPPKTAGPAVPEPAPSPPPVPVSGPPRGLSRAADANPVPSHVVEEVIGAVADIVRRYRRVAVTVTVDDAGSAWTAHVVHTDDGQLAVTRLEQPRGVADEAAEHWPPGGERPGESGQPTGVPERTASRLADMIRRDPRLLDPPDGRRR